MNTNSNRKQNGTRLQFSIRTLLILAMIVGPILGWYGPTALDILREFYADEPTTSQVPTPAMQKLQAQLSLQNSEIENYRRQLQQRIRALKERPLQPIPVPSATDQIELGMRAGLWEHELQRVE